MNFNEQQKKIIDSIFGAYLVSAPVGTGKTTVLTERVAVAMEKGIKPEEILCLTFTNRAAEEMQQRIRRRIGKKEAVDALTIKTFHGFCAFFIKAEAKRIGINSDFVIFDDDEQVEVMGKILENFPGVIAGGFGEKRQISDLIERLYKYRLNQLEREIGCDLPVEGLDKILLEINEKYSDELKSQNALDFNELVLLTMKTLYLDKELKSKWSKRYKFIQLDEFQDTHLSEYLVVKELAKTYKNFSLIGDLDQTIYGWRGSEPFKIVAYFKSHFAPVEEIHLEMNYRFNKHISSAVKSFLTSFKKASTKKMECFDSGAGDEKCVEVFAGYNLTEEVGRIIEKVKALRASDPDAKIAVLLRTNPAINRVAEIFAKNNIAHVTVDKYDFFRRQEVKDVYAYLKIIFNKFDLESAYRLVQRPARNIGPATVNAILEEGAPVGLKVSDFLNFKNYNYIEPFANLIGKWNAGRIIVLDTETTGTNVLKDEIIQIYAIEVINGQPGKDFHFYLKNTIPVGNSADVHGITDEFLRENGREPAGVIKELKEFINNDVISGHNVNFDLSMIAENSKRKGIDIEFKEYYDTLDIAKRLVDSENYKLNTLAKLLGLSSATHDAKDDVLATVGLLGVLTEKLKARHLQRVELFSRYSKKFIQLSGLINSWQKIAREKRPAEALEFIWQDSGLKDFYGADKDCERRFKSIETLAGIFKERDDLDRQADIVLRELIQFASLVRDLNFLGLEKGKVPIVTVHQVKGLEFDYVFIAGVNEFRFPIYKSDVEEEKRLFYVALTRARKKIFISYSNFDDYGKPMGKSSFIGYIDGQYLEYIN